MNKQERERLQASLDHWNKRAIEEDAIYREQIRQELANRKRLEILSTWAGDTGGFSDEV